MSSWLLLQSAVGAAFEFAKTPSPSARSLSRALETLRTGGVLLALFPGLLRLFPGLFIFTDFFFLLLFDFGVAFVPSSFQFNSSLIGPSSSPQPHAAEPSSKENDPVSPRVTPRVKPLPSGPSLSRTRPAVVRLRPATSRLVGVSRPERLWLYLSPWLVSSVDVSRHEYRPACDPSSLTRVTERRALAPASLDRLSFVGDPVPIRGVFFCVPLLRPPIAHVRLRDAEPSASEPEPEPDKGTTLGRAGGLAPRLAHLPLRRISAIDPDAMPTS